MFPQNGIGGGGGVVCGSREGAERENNIYKTSIGAMIHGNRVFESSRLSCSTIFNRTGFIAVLFSCVGVGVKGKLINLWSISTF